MRRFGRLLSYACCILAVAGPALAQVPYPSKPIRIVVPYAPGGLTDVVARLYSEQLRQSLGRGVFVGLFVGEKRAKRFRYVSRSRKRQRIAGAEPGAVNYAVHAKANRAGGRDAFHVWGLSLPVFFRLRALR